LAIVKNIYFCYLFFNRYEKQKRRRHHQASAYKWLQSKDSLIYSCGPAFLQDPEGSEKESEEDKKHTKGTIIRF